jgi:hypothetical protein
VLTQESPFERGRQFGRLYRSEGRDYVRPYPSNPYHASDPRHREYADGYEEGACEAQMGSSAG